MQRTHVQHNLPHVLKIAVKPKRTPIINGKIAKPVSDLIRQTDPTPKDIKSSLHLNEMSPHTDPLWDRTHEMMLRSSLAYFFEEVIMGPPEAPYYGKSLVGRHHVEWDHIVNTHDRFLIEAARDHGKCRVAGSLLIAADGRRVPVEQWTGGQVIAYDPQTFSLIPSNSTASKCVGKTTCYKITTRTGRTETVADWHRFATIDGWIHAEDLLVGQRIAVPKKLTLSTTRRWPRDMPWLLGLILGDGGLTLCDPALIDAAELAAANNGWQRLDTPKKWIRDLGLEGVGAEDKIFPDEVFELADDDIAEVLAGWFDADGSVNPHGGGCIEVYSVSEALIRAGLHLLTRLGVVSVLSIKKGKYKGADHYSWRLTIRGPSICVFARQVRLRGQKQAQLRALAARQADKGDGGSVDLLPCEVYRKIAAIQQNSRLSQLADSDILWDEVVEIECVGEQAVYAIEVEKYQSYVGQDIVNHNSHYFSLAYPIWRAGYTHPGKLGYVFSATQELSQSFLAIIKDEIENNPKLQHLLPVNRSKNWSQRQITLRNGSTIRARGMGTKVRGGHPYWIIVDDGLTDEAIYSETIRRRIIDYFLSAITNMIVPGGQIGVCGTPMHFADLYYHLKSTGEYYHKQYPAIDRRGRILFPERYDRERLEKRKRELNSLARFAREFLCQPLSDEASLFPSHLFEGEIRQPYTLGLPAEYWEELGMPRFTGIDFAMSSSARADRTIILTIAVDGFGNRWLANIRVGEGWGFQRQLDEIKEENELMKPDVVHAEANQMQRIFSDEVIRTTDIPIRKFFTSGVQPKMPWRKGMASITMNKHHLERGVPSLRMSLENGKWRIPRGDRKSIDLTDMWMGEFQAMSWQDGNVVSVGEHDDHVMATWMADTAARLGGFRFSFGEEETKKQSVPSNGEKPKMDANTKPVNLEIPEAGQYSLSESNNGQSDEWKPQLGAPKASDIGFGGPGW